MTALNGISLVPASPFEDRQYLDIWWECLAPKFPILLRQGDLLIHPKPVLKHLISLKELRIAAWHNAWMQDLTLDRLQQISQLEGWDYFRMTWSESRRSLQAFDALADLRLEAIHTPSKPQYVVDLSQGVETYLKALSQNSRKSFTKRYRKAMPLNPEMVTISGESAIDAFFEAFFKWHILYWRKKEGACYFDDPHERGFMVTWAKQLDKAGRLIASQTRLNGELVALNISVHSGDTLYWLLTITTGVYQEYGPGILGLYLCLMDAEKRGVKRFNMGSGDYFYKVQAANHIETCTTVIVPNPKALKGKMYGAWFQRQNNSRKACHQGDSKTIRMTPL